MKLRFPKFLRAENLEDNHADSAQPSSINIGVQTKDRSLVLVNDRVLLEVGILVR